MVEIFLACLHTVYPNSVAGGKEERGGWMYCTKKMPFISIIIVIVILSTGVTPFVNFWRVEWM